MIIVLYTLIAFVLFSSAVTLTDTMKYNKMYKLLPNLRFESSQMVINSNLLIYGYVEKDEQEWHDLIGDFDKDIHIFVWYYPSNLFKIKFYLMGNGNIFHYCSPYYSWTRIRYIRWAERYVLENFKDIYLQEKEKQLL